MPTNGVRRIRAHVDLEVMVKAKTVTVHDAHTVDISLSGMLIHANAKLSVGENCETQITLKAAPPIILKMRGHVARQTDHGFAINFDEMDLDTLEHLQNLVMYNAKDPEAVAEQSAQKPGFK